MEGVLVLLALIFGPAILRAIFSGLAGESDQGSIPKATDRLLRVEVAPPAEKVPGLSLLEVRAKAFGVVRPMGASTVRFYTSLVDVTDEEVAPVMALMEPQQEASTYAFQFPGPEVPVTDDFTMTGFVTVGAIAQEVLHFAETGRRSVKVIVRLLAGDALPGDFRGGVYVGSPGRLLCEGSVTTTMVEEAPGYRAAARHEVEALDVGATVGVGVAAADGAIASEELEVIQDWLRGQVGRLSSGIDAARERCNEALEKAHDVVRNGGDPLSGVARRLAALPESHQARVLELGYRVLAADGEADAGELAVLEKLSRAAGIDADVVTRIHDLTLLSVQTIANDEGAELPALLGFDPNDSPETIRRHLRGLMQKWNARSANAKTTEERDRVQLMLQRIADATSRYTS
ncbi:tellurite resistance TerB family protein [Planctomycetota bacterium]|nr:tellurite resistance TerB family protein [Planctomycetota bacterium]